MFPRKLGGVDAAIGDTDLQVGRLMPRKRRVSRGSDDVKWDKQAQIHCCWLILGMRSQTAFLKMLFVRIKEFLLVK